MRWTAAKTLRVAYETLEVPADDEQRLIVHLPADHATASAPDKLTTLRPQPLRLVVGQFLIHRGMIASVIRVLLAEDVRMLREALVGVLELADDVEVVAAVEAGDAIVPTALRTRPDVAVIDIEMPGLDGISAAAQLHQWVPQCRTLMLTGVGRPGTLRRALAAKVSGFMVKDSAPEDLVVAVRTIAAGGRVIDPQLAFAALDVDGNPLTDREIDVLRLTASGAEPTEVATRLGLSYGTVRNYLASAVTKLDARNRVDAIRIATEAGWI